MQSGRDLQFMVLAQGFCYGCGLQLQTEFREAAGFVEPTKYAVKAQHKHLSTVLCERCQHLSNGQMIPAVEDFSSRNTSGLRCSCIQHSLID